MRRSGWRLVLGLVAFAIVPLEAKREQWPHERSELPPAPEVVWGSLDNGFGYALLPRDQKPGLISMRLVVEVGSLDEQDDERGLAHFVEHMAFRETKHFQRGELVDFFRRLGMSFGVDVNAFTYHDKTVYHLELPNNDPELIDQSLLLLRDYADGIVFSEESLEKERSVILREKQARSAPSARIMEEASRFAFAGTLLAERHPIGLRSVIAEASLPQLRAFYDRWYRADLMTLVVAGDVDPETFQERLGAAFGSLETPRGRVPKRRIGKIKADKAFRLRALDVEGVERHTLQMTRAWIERRSRDSWKRREEDARRGFATEVFNERCRRTIGEVSNDFAFYARVLGIPYCHLTISAGGEPSIDGFIWMDRMLRQALEFGFTEAEVEFVKRSWRQMNRSNAAQYQSAEPRLLVDQLVERIANDEVYLGLDHQQEWVERFVEELDVADVNAAFRQVWQLNRLGFFVAGDFEQAPTRAELEGYLVEDRKLSLPPYWAELPESFAYTEIGQPGSVLSEERIEDIGASVYRFDNNTRLVFLRTENERDTVRALVRVGGGMLTFSDANPATHALAMNSLFRSGFGSNAIEDVYAELRGHVTSFFFGIEDHDAFTYRALAPSDGLDEFLRIVAEYLLDPTVDDAAFALAQMKLRQTREMEADGLSEGYRELHKLLYPDQPRFHAPTLGDIDAVDPQKIRNWLEEPLRSGYLEVIVVGDADEEAVLAAVSSTLGALPERQATKPAFAEVRALKVDSLTGKRRIEYENGKGENAASVVVWTVQDPLDFREGAAANVLANLLEERLRKRAREEMGASYAPQVEYVTYAAYETVRHIRADVDCMQGDAEAMLDVIMEVARGLAAQPVSPAELSAAIAPMEEAIRQAWRDNGFLIENVLYGVHEYPYFIRNALRYRDGALSTLTPLEIQGFAKRYLAEDDALAVAIVPGARAKLAEAPEGARLEPAGAAP